MLSAKRFCYQLPAQCLNCKSKSWLPWKSLAVYKYKLIFRISFLHFQHKSYNLSRLYYLFIMCWLQKYYSLQSRASEHDVPLQRGQGVTSHDWSSQMLGHLTLPSPGGEFPDTEFLRPFRQLETFLNKSFQKLKQQNLGKSENLTLSNLFAKMAVSISSGRRQSRHLGRPAGCWGHRGLSFLPCLCGQSHICCFARHWRKSQAARTAVTAGRSSPSLSCHSQGRTHKPGSVFQLTLFFFLFFFYRQTGKPQDLRSCGSKIQLCYTAEKLCIGLSTDRCCLSYVLTVKQLTHTKYSTPHQERLKASCKP